MKGPKMRLRVLLPANVLLDETVIKIVAEAIDGSFCLLPKHRDFVTSLVPGILSFLDESGAESFVAVSEGVLTKSGDEVLISTRRASRSERLDELQQVVQNLFQTLDDRERVAQAVMARLEADFMRRLLTLEEGPHV
jgi:F-type H+-transporting ATPase subunit epsilon